MKKFVYVYSMVDKPERIEQLRSQHLTYWKEQNVKNFIGGTFSDNSGGLITFETDDYGNALGIAACDPYVLGNVVAVGKIKEWVVSSDTE